MKSSFTANRAFTLVELLIVITIIGVLVVALLPRLTGGREKARDAARLSHLQQISTALELYASDHEGLYPSGRGCIQTDYTSEIGTYLTSIPQELVAGNAFSDSGCYGNGQPGGYEYAGTENGYILLAALENVNTTGDNIYDDTTLDDGFGAVTLSTTSTQEFLDTLDVIAGPCLNPGDCEIPLFILSR